MIIFEKLNDKSKDSIIIETNKLISQNIYSLRIFRNIKISLVI